MKKKRILKEKRGQVYAHSWPCRPSSNPLKLHTINTVGLVSFDKHFAQACVLSNCSLTRMQVHMQRGTFNLSVQSPMLDLAIPQA